MQTGQPGERPRAPESGPQTTPYRTLQEPDRHIRAARLTEADAVATILAEAFPGLYRAMFGTRSTEESAWLLTELYQAGLLSLQTTRVCERGSRVVGVAVLHVGGPLIYGGARAYWRLFHRQLGLLRAPRAFLGGLIATYFMERRIPVSDDLVYIKALAVMETERGRGVGTRLLQDAARWAVEQNRSWLALHVLNSNTRARRLYERMGFRPWPAGGRRPLWSRLLTRYRPDWSGLLMLRPTSDAGTLPQPFPA